MIMRDSSLTSGLVHPMEHGHLHRQAVVGLALHHAARGIEHLIGDGGIAPHRQAVHHAALARRDAEPVIAHAPAGERAAQAGIGFRIAVAPGRAPLLYIHDLGAGERVRARGTARSSSVFQSASAWQGWLTADSRLMSGLSVRLAMALKVVSARSLARSRPAAKARMPSASQ